MPTARELLEQADALMRRNRSPMVDDIPVLTDSVEPAAEARVLRGRGSVARVPPPPVADAIPTLTERVAPSPPPPDEVAQEGEPSDWLQLEGSEPSVIGEAPDSIAIVPDVAQPPPAEDVDIFAPEPDTVQVVTAAEAEEEFEQELSREAVPVAPPPPSTTAAALAAEFAGTPPSIDVVPPVDDAPEFEDETEEIAVDLQPLPEPEPEPEAQVEPAAEREPEPIAALPEPEAQGMTEPLEDALLRAAPAAASVVTPSPEQEEARWASMAEEIRMQVLQRIDLFTDTGLREQLGARLQPIVDRASADLVATINQHVGELLRAYVAEAIEREIESWRRNN